MTLNSMDPRNLNKRKKARIWWLPFDGACLMPKTLFVTHTIFYPIFIATIKTMSIVLISQQMKLRFRELKFTPRYC